MSTGYITYMEMKSPSTYLFTASWLAWFQNPPHWRSSRENSNLICVFTNTKIISGMSGNTYLKVANT